MPISIFSIPETKTTWGRVRIGSVSFIVFRCDVNMRSWKYQNFAASKYAFSLPTAASLKIINFYITLGPLHMVTVQGSESAYCHIAMFAYIVISSCRDVIEMALMTWGSCVAPSAATNAGGAAAWGLFERRVRSHLGTKYSHVKKDIKFQHSKLCVRK